MALNILGQFQFGGVDVQSNPITLPPSRSLRCRNWSPKVDGHLELRYGYSTVSQDSVTAAAINSPVFYRKWDGSKNVVFIQGTTLKNGAISGSTLTVTNPTVRGATVTSTATWDYYNINNRLHAGNGTHQKFFDGTTWRDNGIAGPSAGTGSAVTVSQGATVSGGFSPSVFTASAGYQFYMAYYNPLSGQISNRVKIGSRHNPGTPSEVNLANLPSLSTVDTELVKIFGRTGDAAEVPYIITDSAGNIFQAGNTATTATIGTAYVSFIEAPQEVPFRNGVIPATLNKFAVVSDRVWGNADGTPTIYRSASAVDERSGDFAGRPEQSWAPNDIETFPTAEAVTAIAEVDGELFAATLNDSAILSDIVGALLWRGPWAVGGAGKRAFSRTPYGFFWVTGEKQLATFRDGIPVTVSSEYERALLAQIGDANLSTVECHYFNDPTTGADVLVIKALDSNNNPMHIVHDFALADERSPEGQGYDGVYVGQLATDYSPVLVRDANGRGRLWAAANNGRFYQTYDGANDGGVEYTADYLALVNAGQERLGIPHLDWVGDQKVAVSAGRKLKTSIAENSPNQPEVLVAADAAEAVAGEEDNFQFRAKLKAPEVNHLYLRFQLTSHSADGSLALNSPPHVPLEDYGRIYAIYPAVGQGRAR